MERKKKMQRAKKDEEIGENGEKTPCGDGEESSGLESDNEYELLVEA
jgi:hypothetical protein